MASHNTTDEVKPLDLSKWRPVPLILMIVGGIGALIGAFVSTNQFAFSWLTTFMFYLSLMLGGLFLVIVHHLFDANWSVPIRRINEHLACLAPVLAALFIPVMLLRERIWKWMTMDPPDHALHAKHALLNETGFFVVAILCFTIWTVVSWALRSQSLAQDRTGSPVHTKRMRVIACIGVVLFALSLTMGVIMWVKALHHQWFSTMFGVWYFAGSTWVTLATVYFITMCLKRMGPLKDVVGPTQFYFIGSLIFAFTVFYAYVTFSQYFIIWNANIPEETFWYVLREKGSWYDLSQLIIFGHFFIPFLLLLRIDFKLMFPLMTAIMLWAWLMHYCDMQFNVMPAFRPDGFMLHWLDIACMAFFGGLLSKIWMIWYFKHPPFPQKDPRIAETLGVYVEPVSATRTGAQTHPA
ncbi:MAG: hypothetical protein ACXW32_04105 [Limisphaerales bacterium]